MCKSAKESEKNNNLSPSSFYQSIQNDVNKKLEFA